MDSSNASASEESGDGMPSHGKVDRDSITFLDTEGLEDIRDGTNLAEKFRVANFATLTRFVRFVNNGCLRSRRSA